MAISYEDISADLCRIMLSGRLDFQGVEDVLGKFEELLATSAAPNVVVDLSDAVLICSIGIRALILNAKALEQSGRHMLLVMQNDSMVSKTLNSVGIDTLLPVFTSISEAEASLG